MMCLCYGSAANTRKLESDLFSRGRKRSRLGGLSSEQVERKKSEPSCVSAVGAQYARKLESDLFVRGRYLPPRAFFQDGKRPLSLRVTGPRHTLHSNHGSHVTPTSTTLDLSGPQEEEEEEEEEIA